MKVWRFDAEFVSPPNVDLVGQVTFFAEGTTLREVLRRRLVRWYVNESEEEIEELTFAERETLVAGVWPSIATSQILAMIRPPEAPHCGSEGRGFKSPQPPGGAS